MCIIYQFRGGGAEVTNRDTTAGIRRGAIDIEYGNLAFVLAQQSGATA